LFATLAGRSISVAAKEVKEIVGSDPDRVGAGQWTEVSEEKNRRRKLERDERARVGCGSFREGRNLPDKIVTGRSRVVKADRVKRQSHVER